MGNVDVKLPSPHDAQRRIEADARRFNLMVCGRRFGKDIVQQRRIVKKALHTKQPVAWFAPSYRMLLENWRTLRSILQPVTIRASDTEHRLDLITGNPLEMWSLDNPDSARGRKYVHVTINEAAMVKDLMSAWTMVIRPTLADYQGSADFGTTPKGLNGLFELWNQAEDNPQWARFHYRTDDNPYIPRSEIEDMRASLPERVVRQEIDAEFVEDGAYFQNVDKSAILTEQDTPEQHAGHDLYMAMDWGKSNDYSVFGIGCRQCAKVVAWERFNQIDYIYQRQRAASMRDMWSPGLILPERNSIGEPNIELLVNDGWSIMRGHDDKFGFYTGPTTKPPLIEALAQAFIVHGFKVPEAAKSELSMFEVNVMSSGHSQFSAPDGQHDDWVMMLALLWYAMTSTSWVMAGRY